MSAWSDRRAVDLRGRCEKRHTTTRQPGGLPVRASEQASHFADTVRTFGETTGFVSFPHEANVFGAGRENTRRFVARRTRRTRRTRRRSSPARGQVGVLPQVLLIVRSRPVMPTSGRARLRPAATSRSLGKMPGGAIPHSTTRPPVQVQAGQFGVRSAVRADSALPEVVSGRRTDQRVVHAGRNSVRDQRTRAASPGVPADAAAPGRGFGGRVRGRQVVRSGLQRTKVVLWHRHGRATGWAVPERPARANGQSSATCRRLAASTPRMRATALWLPTSRPKCAPAVVKRMLPTGHEE